MAKRTYQSRLYLDMPFGEALERFVGTDPKQVEANVSRAKQKKPPGGKRAPPGKVDMKNVASLRDRRVRKRTTGR